MTPMFSPEQIFDYWTSQAFEHRQSPSASWSDHPAIELEIREITKWLQDGDAVLETGCANGYSSVCFACARRIHIRGVDYIPEMVEQARLRLNREKEQLKGSVEFAVGDITQL